MKFNRRELSVLRFELGDWQHFVDLKLKRISVADSAILVMPCEGESELGTEILNICQIFAHKHGGRVKIISLDLSPVICIV